MVKKKEETEETGVQTGENEAVEEVSVEAQAADAPVEAAADETPAEAAPAEEAVAAEAVPAEEAVAVEAAPAPERPKKEKKAAAPQADAPAEATPAKTVVVHKRAEKVGIVSSDKMMKTVTVRVDRLIKHPIYRKYVKKRKKFMAHDDLGAHIGDKVKIVETRPLSARKRWRVVEIIQKAQS